MIVTDITEVNKKQSRIFIDGQYSFTLYSGEIRRLSVKKGESLSEDIYNSIMNDILLKRCKLRSMYLLQKQDYTEYKLRTKLKMAGYPDSVIALSFDYLREYGYLNDKRYAGNYIYHHASSLSKRKLFNKMYEKGISDEIIREAYEEYSMQEGAVNEKAMIEKYLNKKHFDAKNADRKERDKMIRSLLNKGFSINDIIACFNLT